jgi:wyosine [tRNA(Phe)-imidazoG37] synthetase (radical SAM superfamily)
MATFLFDKIIFGPVISRRLGESLGINLLPGNRKICNFNCIYCECGPTDSADVNKYILPSRNEVRKELEFRLRDINKGEVPVDTVTYAGNGEPTLHPEFPEIVYDTIELRNKYLPDADIAVLSNSTHIDNNKIYNALNKVDLNILKLDSGFESTCKIINCPLIDFNHKRIVENLKNFNGNLIIQTLFFRGTYKGRKIDNTTEKELEKWLETIKFIQPESIMIYTIARDTPNKDLYRIPFDELLKISEMVEEQGIISHISP